MQNRYGPVERKFWINAVTGARASVYGVWSVVTDGWTVYDSREGTYGVYCLQPVVLGRPCTLADAEAFCRRKNAA